MIGILLILGLACADKLDRTYLPPPGSEFSGGNPDALEVPLDQPKLQYPSKDTYLESPQVAIGIDRVGPKGQLDIYSTSNPSIYPENAFVTPATYVSPKDVNPTTNSGDHSSHYYHDTQNPKNLYQNYNQPEYHSVSNVNQFQTTENYPHIIQGVVNRKDNSFGSLPNQMKAQGERVNSINVDISKPSLSSSDLLTNSLPNKYDLGQKSTLPISPIQTNNNFISTLSPSINYNYSSTEKPKQVYFSTPATPELSTTIPKSYTFNSPVFDTGYNKRPERVQAQADREASILNYENTITPDGYSYTFDTSNGIHGDESGIARNGVKAKGSYSYIGDDGKLYSIKYTADESGFQPQGDHLPTSPPIPDAILKVIEQVTKEKEAGIFDDGSYDENKYGYRKYHNGFNHPTTDFSNGKKYLGKNNSDKKPITDQNFNKNKYVVPENNKYKMSSKHFENMNTYVPLEPNQFRNTSEFEHFGKFDDADHEIGDEETNRSPNFFLGSVYKNSESSKEGKQMTANNVGQNRPNEDFSKESNEESGYQYNPPPNRGLKKFPSRFSDIYDIKNERPIQTKNVNPKPFLTPYALQNKDIVKNYDNYGKPSENTEGENYGEEIIQNNNNDDRDIYSIYAEDNLDGKGSYQPDEKIFRKNNQYEEAKFNDYEPDTTDEGYSYQQGTLDSNNKSYDSFASTSPKGYSSSTVIPDEIITRGSVQSQYPVFSDGTPQTVTGEKSIYTTSTSAPNLDQVNIQLKGSDSLPTYDYSSKRPEFIDQSDRRMEQSVSLTDYPKEEFNITTPKSELSRNIPIFSNSYAPSIDILYTDKSTTEKYIGEDFNGPKQAQRFDPKTGYYY
ncbi:putative uncharacterized protein DDB_G0282133 [Vanessa tameamea]|uniref:Uncharacterized protein n=1 Tax=Vanessa tameamea TaxID=334116 RepID=A0ABM4ARD0_VANTA